MEVCLTATFDLGVSYGLGDDVFSEAATTGGWETGWVGLTCPLGEGVVVDFADSAADVISEWRAGAAAEAFRDEMEIGRPASLGTERTQYDEAMADLAASVTIESCRVTIYSVGTAFLELRFGSDLPKDRIRGILRMFEYSAYHPAIARKLHGAAVEHVRRTALEIDTPLTHLSQRQLPQPLTDSTGREELRLVRSIVPVLELTEEHDRGEAEELMTLFDPKGATARIFDFEFHGRLHYSSECRIFETRSLVEGSFDRSEAVLAIGRLQACHQIANVLGATVGSFDSLLSQETHRQVEAYAKPHVPSRTPAELNGLRALALAVLSRTTPDAVTAVHEDQAFLKYFADIEATAARQERVARACEVIYSVQAAETQDRNEKRQNFLNGVVFILTAVTLLSVSSDAYNFVRENESIVSDRSTRTLLLAQFVLLLGAGLFLVIYLASRATEARARRKSGACDVGAGYSDPTRPGP